LYDLVDVVYLRENDFLVEDAVMTGDELAGAEVGGAVELTGVELAGPELVGEDEELAGGVELPPGEDVGGGGRVVPPPHNTVASRSATSVCAYMHPKSIVSVPMTTSVCARMLPSKTAFAPTATVPATTQMMFDERAPPVRVMCMLGAWVRVPEIWKIQAGSG
jgi:hypothetical protein